MKTGLSTRTKIKKSKIGKHERKRSGIKKRSLLILAILALLLVLVPASGITKGILKESSPEGQNTENVGKEAEIADDINLGDLENHLASDFIKVLKSDQYTIRYKTTTVYDGQPYEVETTFAVSGDNTAMISSGRATVVRDDVVYMLNHADKSIISWDVNRDKGSPKRIDTEGLAYQGSSEEAGLTCEEYTTPSSHLKLYFKDKELVKMAARIDDEDVVMNILEIKKEASDTLFEVPSGYSTTNI